MPSLCNNGTGNDVVGSVVVALLVVTLEILATVFSTVVEELSEVKVLEDKGRLEQHLTIIPSSSSL